MSALSEYFDRVNQRLLAQQASEKTIEEIEQAAEQALHIRALWRPDLGEAGQTEDRYDKIPSVLTIPPERAYPGDIERILADNEERLHVRLGKAKAAAYHSLLINQDVARQLGIPITAPQTAQSRKLWWRFRKGQGTSYEFVEKAVPMFAQWIWPREYDQRSRDLP